MLRKTAHVILASLLTSATCDTLFIGSTIVLHKLAVLFVYCFLSLWLSPAVDAGKEIITYLVTPLVC